MKVPPHRWDATVACYERTLGLQVRRREATSVAFEFGPNVLTRATLLQGVEELAARDRRLAAIVEDFGPPPLFARPRGFPTLSWIILEQQVSLASAAALFSKLKAAVAGAVTPDAVMALGMDGLLRLGFTRQKARYVHGLAERIAGGQLELGRLAALDDADAGHALLAVPGIGPWTAGIYLLMALRRPDVWPPGDLGLHKSLAEVRCLREVPSTAVATSHALRWRPWRAVAARLLWHAYLSRRRKPPWGAP
jgi:DNA-3-methyladenine glycosylase II